MGLKTIWEVGIDIDKMWWLLATCNTHNDITLCPWDCNPSEIKWSFIVDSEIVWEWILLTQKRLANIFKPFQEDGITPRPFRLRQWSLWFKKKRKGLIRLQNTWKNSVRLILTDWWWAELHEITQANIWNSYRLWIKNTILDLK